MAAAGIGVDMVSIERMEGILKKTPAFALKVFTDEERRFCEASNWPAAHYACRFAAREAVLKALGIGFSNGVGRHDVSVAVDAAGKEFVVLSGKVAQIAQELGIDEFALSLTFTNEIAVANAMAITAEARPKPKEVVEDGKTRIARSFKEARALLDELDRVQDDGTIAAGGDEAIEG